MRGGGYEAALPECSLLIMPDIIFLRYPYSLHTGSYNHRNGVAGYIHFSASRIPCHY